MRRYLTVLLALFALVTLGFAPVASAATRPAVAGASHHFPADLAGGVRVTGDVATPAAYTAAQLRALPQVSLPDTRSRFGGTVTGVSLASLVTTAAPVLPAAKNASLRVLITVSGLIGTRTVTLGELNPSNGNHPALLAFSEDGFTLPGGPYLAVPGDNGFARTVIAVRTVHVTVVDPATPTGVTPGDLSITSGRCVSTLPAATIAALPTTTVTVNFQAGSGPQTHTETGPTLAAVLRAAHIRVTATTAVTAIGSDGYLAAVTPAEATSGRRPLLLSTVEDGMALTGPRLVTDGDVSGGRYDSGLVGLLITGSPSCR